MRIVIADQMRASREALELLIQTQPDMEVAGTVSDLFELLSVIKAVHPDLVILDWDLLGQRFETLADLLGLFTEPPRIIALSVRDESRKTALEQGITGFACKADAPGVLLELIRSQGVR